jgi:hypothetical protein
LPTENARKRAKEGLKNFFLKNDKKAVKSSIVPIQGEITEHTAQN